MIAYINVSPSPVSSDPSCIGRVAIVTGAGRGLGRSYALALATAGAMVVVNNDLRTDVAEGHAEPNAAERTADEIIAAGGQAAVSTADISDWDSAGRLIDQAVSTFGGLDILVNNAGNLRDRMIVNMTSDDWDAVMRVHLRGTLAPLRWAAEFWRGRAKAGQAGLRPCHQYDLRRRSVRQAGPGQLRCG